MVFDKVQERIASQLDIAKDKVKMESTLVDDLKADSLDVVELIMDMEQEFDIEITDDELESMKTVGDIVGFIERAKGRV